MPSSTPPTRNAQNLARKQAQLLKAPINIIRYLQEDKLQNERERQRLVLENQRLSTELRFASVTFMGKPALEHEELVAMNKKLMAENERLTTSLYTANLLAENQKRDFRYLFEGGKLQTQEAFVLKNTIEEQRKELWKLKNPQAPEQDERQQLCEVPQVIDHEEEVPFAEHQELQQVHEQEAQDLRSTQTLQNSHLEKHRGIFPPISENQKQMENAQRLLEMQQAHQRQMFLLKQAGHQVPAENGIFERLQEEVMAQLANVVEIQGQEAHGDQFC